MNASSQLNLSKEEGFFTRFETFRDTKRGLIAEFGEVASVVLKGMGRECGKRSCNRITSPEKSEMDVLEELSGWKAEENWGKFSFLDLDLENKTGAVRVENCFEARRTERGEMGCDFLSGFLSGFLSAFLADEVEVIEEECLARGDEACVFRFEPPPKKECEGR